MMDDYVGYAKPILSENGRLLAFYGEPFDIPEFFASISMFSQKRRSNKYVVFFNCEKKEVLGRLRK